MCAEIQHQDRRKFIPTPLHPKSPVPADIEIAQAAELKPIRQVAEEMGLEECELELYGDYKAKIKLEVLDRLADAPDGIYRRPPSRPLRGEGKTTTTVAARRSARIWASACY